MDLLQPESVTDDALAAAVSAAQQIVDRALPLNSLVMHAGPAATEDRIALRKIAFRIVLRERLDYED